MENNGKMYSAISLRIFIYVFSLTNILPKMKIISDSEFHSNFSSGVSLQPEKERYEPSWFLEADKQLNAFLHSF